MPSSRSETGQVYPLSYPRKIASKYGLHVLELLSETIVMSPPLIMLGVVFVSMIPVATVPQ